MTTKYNWEKDLRNNLKRIPESEAESILDYYNELFMDKVEQGFSEREIIKSFGNPFDVAYSIVYDTEENVRATTSATSANASASADMHLSHIQGTNGTNTLVQPATAPSNKKRGGLLARILFFVPFCIISIVLWSLVLGLGLGGLGGAIGWLGMVVFGFIQMANYSAIGGLATVGLSLAAGGAGILITILSTFIIKAAVRITQKYFYMGKHKTKRSEKQ